MNDPKEISTIAAILLVVGLINWVAGARSVRGRALTIRKGASWIAMRWLGLGLWTTSAVATAQDDLNLKWIGLAGAIILLIGTARRSQESPSQGSSLANSEIRSGR